MQTIDTPNKQIGRGKFKPEIIVLHRGEGPFNSIISWFQNPKSQVSAHFVISKDGYIVNMVDTNDTAWHAGKTINAKKEVLKEGVNPNQYTIGIELEGYAIDYPTINQALATAATIKQLSAKYGIPLNNQHVIPHWWINGAKTCPGVKLDIDALIYMAKILFPTKDLNK